MALLIGPLAMEASVDRGSVGELLDATVEDADLDELQVEVGGLPVPESYGRWVAYRRPIGRRACGDVEARR
jgi:hypothetical protein